jgi:osmotically-inducible protein OsmY
MAALAGVNTRSDDAIRSDVLFELKWDPKITASDDIGVAVNDGVVTLSGFVPSYWEEDEAEKAVKSVYGVRRVANDIKVKLPSSRTDAEIAREAVQELESHLFVPSEKIKVVVNNGWVTLEGSVNWQLLKKLAESAVKPLKGVVGITNNIEVRPKVSPDKVKGRIEEALKRSAELDARRVSVDAEGSAVKLYGTVRSWSERDEAERAAWSSPGVTNVESHILVVP